MSLTKITVSVKTQILLENLLENLLKKQELSILKNLAGSYIRKRFNKFRGGT